MRSATLRILHQDSDEMGISQTCAMPAFSGVQASFIEEYLPEALATILFMYCSSKVMVLLVVFDD